MVTFTDGPARGALLELRRAPLLLRVVIDQHSNEVDALDQLNDQPRLGEAVFVYRRIGRAERFHVKACNRRESGYYMNAKYQLHEEQPGDHVGRDRASWQSWAMEQWEKENAIG